MMPTFGVGNYNSGVGQLFYFRTRYYNSKVVSSLPNFKQGCYDLGTNPSSSYMHGHGHGYGDHNEYLYYEALAAVPKKLDEQQQQENHEGLEQ